MKKNVAIVVLAIAALILGASLVRVENQRYAMSIGMCATKEPPRLPDWKCLSHVETRTSWWWHIFYAVMDTF